MVGSAPAHELVPPELHHDLHQVAHPHAGLVHQHARRHHRQRLLRHGVHAAHVRHPVHQQLQAADLGQQESRVVGTRGRRGRVVAEERVAAEEEAAEGAAVEPEAEGREGELELPERVDVDAGFGARPVLAVNRQRQRACACPKTHP